jgi:hypothetical protein
VSGDTVYDSGPRILVEISESADSGDITPISLSVGDDEGFNLTEDEASRIIEGLEKALIELKRRRLKAPSPLG